MPKKTDRREPSAEKKAASKQTTTKPIPSRTPANPKKAEDSPKKTRAKPDKPAKNGRPTLYTEAAAGRILDGLRAGWPLGRILGRPGMPAQATVYLWLAANPGFMERYASSREAGTHALADEILSIADDARNDWMEEINASGETVSKINSEVLARSQLRISSRFKLMGKFNPKHYGEKVAVEHSGEVRQPMTLAEFEKRVAMAEA